MKSYIYCFIAIFFFSTMEFVGKLIANDVSAFAITAWRFLFGGLFLFLLTYKKIKKESKKYKFKDYINIAIPGILNVSISMLFQKISIYYGKANISAIIVSSNSFFVSIFAFLLLKEKITKERITSIIIGIIGLLLIIFGENYNLSYIKDIKKGVIFAVFASITFALYTVISKKEIRKYSNLIFNSLSFIFGSISLFIVSFILNKDIFFEITLKNVLVITYLSIIITAVAYIIFFEGLKEIDSSKGTMFFMFKPIIASIFAYFILNENLKSLQIYGIIVIILGFSYETLKKKFFK